MGERIRGFGSDNHAGVHPEVMAALHRVNAGHVHSYGDDPHTAEAVALLREVLGLEFNTLGRRLLGDEFRTEKGQAHGLLKEVADNDRHRPDEVRPPEPVKPFLSNVKESSVSVS